MAENNIELLFTYGINKHNNLKKRKTTYSCVCLQPLKAQERRLLPISTF